MNILGLHYRCPMAGCAVVEVKISDLEENMELKLKIAQQAKS